MFLQVCAPTGAGKTNIAMIAILHEVCFHSLFYGTHLLFNTQCFDMFAGFT